MDTFINEYCPPSYSFNKPPDKNSSESQNTHTGLDSPFNMDELEAAINALKKYSSPGLDQISNEMLTNTPKNFRKLILVTLNEIFENHSYPANWKEFSIILIPKKSKNKFRPITLASCILKLMEKLIQSRLMHFLETNNLLPDSQSGFRRFKSCSTSISTLITEIHRAFIDKAHLCCLLMGIRSAFDNVNPSILQKILEDSNIPINIKLFIYKLMTDRNLYFKINHELKGPFYRHLGVPQGCVLSPILYTIYIIYLNKNISPHNEIIQFADDTIIINKNKSIEKGLKLIESNMKQIIDLFDSLGLEIAPEKSQLIVFSKSNIANKNLSITVDGIVIKNVPAVKYLGLWFDQKLDWNMHAQFLIDKVGHLLNIITVLRGTWWGGHPQVLMNVYRGLIRSSIEYNSFTINIKDTKLKSRLNKLQYQAIRLALGYRRSTPSNVMMDEAKEPTLQIRASYLADKFIIKLLSMEDHGLLHKLCALLDQKKNYTNLALGFRFLSHSKLKCSAQGVD